MRSACCMVVMAIAALPSMEVVPLMEAAPLMDKGAHATDANFDLSDFFQNSF